MGRGKSFNPEQKLWEAMNYFWFYGYEGTSINELKDYLELSPQSIYDTFGDKESLFLKTLDLFNKIYEQTLQLTLNSEEDASLPEIKVHFGITLRMQIMDQTKGSCYMSNVVTELSNYDDSINQLSKKYFDMLNNSLKHAVRNAVNKGEIPSDRDPEAMALFLTNSLSGLGVLNKAGKSNDEILSIIDMTLRFLDPSHTTLDEETMARVKQIETKILAHQAESFGINKLSL